MSEILTVRLVLTKGDSQAHSKIIESVLPVWPCPGRQQPVVADLIREPVLTNDHYSFGGTGLQVLHDPNQGWWGEVLLVRGNRRPHVTVTPASRSSPMSGHILLRLSRRRLYLQSRGTAVTTTRSMHGTRGLAGNGAASLSLERHLHALVVTKWTNPSSEARNRRATSGFVSPSARLRLRFGPHHKSCNVNY
jgi:hypothetical protein